mgnify:CR=1 FL=1
MRSRRLQEQITTGRSTLPVAILISITFWVLSNFLLPDVSVGKSGYALWQTFIGERISWGQSFISLALYATIGYFLVELNNAFAIIRMRASIQTAIYFLLIACCPMMHDLYAGDIASAAYLVSLFLLFKAYQRSAPMSMLFYSFLFIGIGSLFLPQLMLFIPVFWIGAYNLQALTIKSFFASIIGWSVPYWFLLGHAYFYQEMDLFYQPFIELATFHPMSSFQDIPLWEIATFCYLFILYLVSSIHCLVSSYDDRIQTRTYLLFLIFADFCFFIYILLQPMFALQLFPILLIGVSILVGHLFVLTNSRASNVFFISMLLALILLFGFNIWTVLSNF